GPPARPRDRPDALPRRPGGADERPAARRGDASAAAPDHRGPRDRDRGGGRWPRPAAEWGWRARRLRPARAAGARGPARRTLHLRSRRQPRVPAGRGPATGQLGVTHGPPGAPSESPVRIVLVDDQRLLREGLKTLLELHSDLDVVGEAGDGLVAETAVEQLG